MASKEQKRIDYIRQTGNPYYKMDKTEALTYAAKMGSSDTFRGIGQIGADIIGWDSASDWLKEKDDKLRTIMEHPEWGTEATVAFLSSAVVADPVGYAPIIGWLSKGKKAKNLWDLTKYGAGSAGIIGGLSYVPEDHGGLFVDADASNFTKRVENTGVAAITGGLIASGGGKLVDTIQKARGKGSIFQAPDEIDVKAAKDANTKLSEIEQNVATEGPIKAGTVVIAPDRKNVGKILYIEEDKGTAVVAFTNKNKGTYATKRFALDELRPRQPGSPKKTKVESFDDTTKRNDEVVFVLDRETNRKNPFYITTDRVKNITYRIEKEIDPKTKQPIQGEWKVTSVVEKPNPMTDPTGELGAFPPIITETPLQTFKTLKSAKEFIKNNIKGKQSKSTPDVPIKNVTPDEVDNKIINELSNEANDPNVGYKVKNPVLKFYQERMGTPLKNMVFNNAGESLTGAFGFTIGVNSVEDPNATSLQKLGNGLLYALGGAALTKGFKNLDGRFLDGNISDKVGQAIISDYGVHPDYKKIKSNFRLNKNKIAAEFYDIQQEAAKNLTPEQNNLLWRLMSGELDELDNVTPQILNLNDDARKLIVKYGQEMVDRGLLDAGVFKKNIDTYLKRTYLKHVKNKKGGAMFTESSKIRMIGDELKMRGIVDEVSVSAYNKAGSKWKEESWEILEELKGNKLRVRRDLTKAERVEMEEIEDAAYAISETGRLFANDISTARFFDDLTEDSRFVVDEADYKQLSAIEQANFEKMPDVNIQGTSVKKYGRLSGMYVDKYVKQDLVSTFKMAEEGENLLKPAARAANSLMTLWKKTKTSWNLGTHVANSTSNVILLDFADTEIKYFFKAIKEMNDPTSQLHKDAKIAGIFDVDFVSAELGKYGTEMERAMIQLQDNYNAAGFLNYAKKYLQKGKEISLDKLERAYQLEDQVFRMAVYMDRLDKGFNVEDAALEARRWFIDYDINAPLITTLKKTALPFISYTYRVIPLLAEAAIMRPHKFAKWAAIGYGVDAAGTYLADSNTKEIEKLTMREELSKKMFGVPFMAPTMIRLPWDSENGDSMYLDVSRWIPGGDIFDQRSGKTGVPLLPAPFQPGGLWYDLAYTLATKTDPFTGQEIESINVGDTGFEQLQKALTHFGSKQLPNIPGLPGTYATEKLKKAQLRQIGQQQGEPTSGSAYAPPYSPFEAVMYGLGIKLRPQDATINENVKLLEYQQAYKELQTKEFNINKSYDRESIDIDERNTRLEEIQLEKMKLAAEYEVYQRKLNQLKAKLSKEELKEYEEGRQKKFDGGKVSADFPVPFAKENPSERKDSLGIQSYEDQANLKELNDQMGRLGFVDGGKVSNLAEVILNQIQKNRNYTEEDLEKLREHSRLVGYAESDNIADRVQTGGGPGRGKYQYELSSKDKEGQQGAKTAVNRYINFKQKNKIPLTDKDLELMADKNPDFSKLSEDMQDAIFYADKAMGKLPVDDLVKGRLSQEEAWADYHWAGNPEEREIKLNYFINKNYGLPKEVEEEITKGKLDAAVYRETTR